MAEDEAVKVLVTGIALLIVGGKQVVKADSSNIKNIGTVQRYENVTSDS